MTQNINMNTMPATKPRKGRVLAIVALIIGISSLFLGFASKCAALISAYAWDRMGAIRITACSLVLLLPLTLATILGIVAAVRGAGKGKMIATCIVSGIGMLVVFHNFYMLIYYIGSTF